MEVRAKTQGQLSPGPLPIHVQFTETETNKFLLTQRFAGATKIVSYSLS